jgi:hypothetical protein
MRVINHPPLPESASPILFVIDLPSVPIINRFAGRIQITAQQTIITGWLPTIPLKSLPIPGSFRIPISSTRTSEGTATVRKIGRT